MLNINGSYAERVTQQTGWCFFFFLKAQHRISTAVHTTVNENSESSFLGRNNNKKKEIGDTYIVLIIKQNF